MIIRRILEPFRSGLEWLWHQFVLMAFIIPIWDQYHCKWCALRHNRVHCLYYPCPWHDISEAHRELASYEYEDCGIVAEPLNPERNPEPEPAKDGIQREGAAA